MVKLIKNLILSTILLNSIAFCYTLTNSEMTSYINSKVETEIKNQLKPYSIKDEDIKIKISGIPFNDIITPENQKPEIEIINQSPNLAFQRVQVRRIVVKNSKGISVKSYPINIQTLVYKEVLTAKETINFNSEISSKNTCLEKREISNYLNKVITKLDTEGVSKRNYQKGALIAIDSIKEKSAVSKDSIVDIIFLSDNGLKIKLQGRALKDGAIGDTILVRSDKYNKVYNAKINSTNEVTVRI